MSGDPFDGLFGDGDDERYARTVMASLGAMMDAARPMLRKQILGVLERNPLLVVQAPDALEHLVTELLSAILPERDIVPTKKRWRDDMMIVICGIVAAVLWFGTIITARDSAKRCSEISFAGHARWVITRSSEGRAPIKPPASPCRRSSAFSMWGGSVKLATNSASGSMSRSCS